LKCEGASFRQKRLKYWFKGITPLILIYSIATIFSNSTIFSHSSGIFSQTPPHIPNTPSHTKHPLPFQTPPPISNSLSQSKTDGFMKSLGIIHGVKQKHYYTLVELERRL